MRVTLITFFISNTKKIFFKYQGMNNLYPLGQRLRLITECNDLTDPVSNQIYVRSTLVCDILILFQKFKLYKYL